MHQKKLNKLPIDQILNLYDFNDRFLRLYAVACARYCIDQAKNENIEVDARSIAAVDVAERFANGLASVKELEEAHATSYYAGFASYAHATATSVTAYGAYAYSSACAAPDSTYYVASATTAAYEDCKTILIKMINELSELEQIILKKAN